MSSTQITRLNFSSLYEVRPSITATQESDSTKIDSIYTNVASISRTTTRTEEKIDGLKEALDAGFEATEGNFTAVFGEFAKVRRDLKDIKAQQKLDRISICAMCVAVGVVIIAAGGSFGLGVFVIAGSLAYGHAFGYWYDACDMLHDWMRPTVDKDAKKMD